MKPLLTKKETAKLCNISMGTLDKWIHQGLVPRAIPGSSPKRWYREALKKHFEDSMGLAPSNDDAYDADLEERIRTWGNST